MKAPYRSTLRREQKADTRERILEAAVATLASGIAELSIPAVARAARVAVPTVYRHFPSKRALLAAVATHVHQKLGVLELPLPRDAGELGASTHELFRRLDALEPALRAAMASRLGARVRRETMMARRREIVAAALAE